MHVSLVEIIISTPTLNFNYSGSSSIFYIYLDLGRLFFVLYKTSFPNIISSLAKDYRPMNVLVTQTLLVIKFTFFAYLITLVMFFFGVNKDHTFFHTNLFLSSLSSLLYTTLACPNRYHKILYKSPLE